MAPIPPSSPASRGSRAPGASAPSSYFSCLYLLSFSPCLICPSCCLTIAQDQEETGTLGDWGVLQPTLLPSKAPSGEESPVAHREEPLLRPCSLPACCPTSWGDFKAARPPAGSPIERLRPRLLQRACRAWHSGGKASRTRTLLADGERSSYSTPAALQTATEDWDLLLHPQPLQP